MPRSSPLSAERLPALREQLVRPEQYEVEVEPVPELTRAPAYSSSSNGTPTAADRCRAYLEKIPDSIEGQKGSGKLLQAACETIKFDLSDSDAWSVLSWFNSTKCDPSWSEVEMRHKLDDAQKKAGHERGIRNNLVTIVKQSAAATPAAKDGQVQRDRTVRVWEPKLLTSKEFNAGDYRQEYIINRVLVKGQPFVIGGQSKSMKTSLLVDLNLSIGLLGQSFLGTFAVNRPGNVLFLSGESGEFTLQETMRRVAKAKGVNPDDANVIWGFDLPSISSLIDLDTLRKIIQDRGINVAIIDPLYLCLIAGSATPIQTSNVFQMGPLLRELSIIGQETGCTMGICHHTTKRLERPGEAPTLEDLSMAGIAEWARQWILPGRRVRYVEGSGLHKLWLRVGGSAGHSGLYSVDIDEGKLHDDFSGREWNVTVGSAADARQDSERQKAEAKEVQKASKLTSNMLKVKEALQKVPAGETTRWVREEKGLNLDDANAAIAALLANGAIERCDVIKPNRKAPYEGFRNKPVTNKEIPSLIPPG